MAITPEQLERRKNRLGSSDIPAIMGLDPFKSAYDVWLEKTDKLEPKPETQVTKRGHFIEPALLNFAESILGPIQRESLEIIHSEPNVDIIDHPDGRIKTSGIPVEAKSQGVYSKEEWGESDTDQVPARVIVQSEVHIMCCQSENCYIPAYLPYREFQMFNVPRCNDIIDAILEKADLFWTQNVKQDIPPDAQPTLEVVKRIKRYPDIIDCIVDDTIVKTKLMMDEEFARIKKDKEDATAQLIAAIGQAEFAKWSGGIITFKEYENKGYTVQPYKARKLYLKKGNK